MVHENGRDTIPASRFQLDRVEEIYLSCPIVTPTGLIPGWAITSPTYRGKRLPTPNWLDVALPEATSR